MVLLITPFNVLSDYFDVLLSVEAVPAFRILIKFVSILFEVRDKYTSTWTGIEVGPNEEILSCPKPVRS